MAQQCTGIIGMQLLLQPSGPAGKPRVEFAGKERPLTFAGLLSWGHDGEAQNRCREPL